VFLNDEPLDASSVLYAGVTPGFLGLYQVNLRLPERLEENPRIRVAIGTQISPDAVHLAARASE